MAHFNQDDFGKGGSPSAIRIFMDGMDRALVIVWSQRNYNALKSALENVERKGTLEINGDNGQSVVLVLSRVVALAVVQ